MVLAGGLAQAAMLPLIGIAAIYLRHRHVPEDIQPPTGTTVMLWIATIVMAGLRSRTTRWLNCGERRPLESANQRHSHFAVHARPSSPLHFRRLRRPAVSLKGV